MRWGTNRRRERVESVALGRRIAGLVAVLALLAPIASAGAARRGRSEPRRASCTAFINGSAVSKVNGGYAVTVTMPDGGSPLGAWQGPRSVCYAVFNDRSPNATFPGAAAIWGVGYGVSAGEWNAMRAREGSGNSAEGPGPWSRHTVDVGLIGYSAFVAVSSAGPANGLRWPQLNYLYVRTARHDLLYLRVFPARASQLAALARKVLLAHPTF